MEQMIAGGIILAIAKLTVGMIVLRLAWATFVYVIDTPWTRWTLGTLICAVVYVSYENLWGYVWDHAATWLGVALLLPIPAGIVLVVWEWLQKAYAFVQRTRGRTHDAR